MINICIDAGYGQTKAAVISLPSADDKKKSKDAASAPPITTTWIIPSMVGQGTLPKAGRGRFVLREIDLGLGDGKGRKTRPFEIAIDGQEFLVGPNVHKYTAPTDRLDLNRYTDSVELRALLFTVLARLDGESENGHRRDHADGANVLLALPVELLDKKQADAVVNHIASWLTGEHAVKFNGHSVHLKVNQVRSIPQPIGAFFAWGFDLYGNPRRTMTALKARKGVLDIGYGTAHAIAIEGNDIVDALTVSDFLGLHQAAQRIVERVLERFQYRMSLRDADNLIRAHATHKEVSLGIDAVDPHLPDIVAEAVRSSLVAVLNLVRPKWQRGDIFSTIIVPGGGALVYGERLREEFPRVEILESPVLANALGGAAVAHRIFRG